jgi:hypothetical protein
MANRREFLQSGITASVVPMVLGGWRLKAAGLDHPFLQPDSEGTRLYKVLFDLRLPDSVIFGDEAAVLGADTAGFRGDITDFWVRDLSRRWKREPVAIAGLTTHGALFCLERWGWDHGLRVVYRAEHLRQSDGLTGHTINGPTKVVAQVREALGGKGPWSAQLPRAMTTCPAGKAVLTTEHVTTTAQNGPPADEPLYSWVIAPTSRS